MDATQEKRQLNEKLVYVATTHWMKYFPKLLLSLLLGASGVLLLILAWYVRSFPVISLVLFLVGLMLNLVAHHRFFHALFSEEAFDIIITSKRVIYFDDCLFLSDDEHEIPLHKVASVDASQRGLLQNILNFGTLWLDTGGGTVDLRRTIPYVSKTDYVANLIADILEEHSS